MKHLMRNRLGLAALLVALGASPSVTQAVPFTVGDIFGSVSNGQVQHRNSAGTLLETLN